MATDSVLAICNRLYLLHISNLVCVVLYSRLPSAECKLQLETQKLVIVQNILKDIKATKERHHLFTPGVLRDSTLPKPQRLPLFFLADSRV